ncbi:hypothetical protein AVEN_184672-1 [Araneus ventricosus]|uniref:Uncharacterized protein n=1 Tax=Araneus ventricosus TaxID=182803 RepID=A0A4Y2FVJ2_ARAVE|nr:hypothetical protein AVEN_184672-1 [Araneus ventricosus]
MPKTSSTVTVSHVASKKLARRKSVPNYSRGEARTPFTPLSIKQPKITVAIFMRAITCSCRTLLPCNANETLLMRDDNRWDQNKPQLLQLYLAKDVQLL